MKKNKQKLGGNIKVAVYGSLRKGFGNHRLLRASIEDGRARYIKDEIIKGFRLYTLGWFPAVLPSDKEHNSVKIEIYEVDDQTLENLDYLEGYKEGDNDNLYNRVEIEHEGEKLFIYVFNGNINERDLIESGDWAEYNKKDNAVLS